MQAQQTTPLRLGDIRREQRRVAAMMTCAMARTKPTSLLMVSELILLFLLSVRYYYNTTYAMQNSLSKLFISQLVRSLHA